MIGIVFKTIQYGLWESTRTHTHRQARTLVFNLPITDEFLGDEAEYFWLLLDFKSQENIFTLVTFGGLGC